MTQFLYRMTLTRAAPMLCYDAMALCVSVVYKKTGLVILLGCNVSWVTAGTVF